MDYFHGQLVVSPDGNWVADNGWIWHPMGAIATWNLDRWLTENVWESEDGPSRRALWWGKYDWNDSICWLNEHEIGITGQFEADLFDEEELAGIPACWLFRSYDARTGELTASYPIARGKLFYADHVFCSTDQNGVLVYDAEGNVIFQDASMHLKAYSVVSDTFVDYRDDLLTFYIPASGRT